MRSRIVRFGNKIAILSVLCLPFMVMAQENLTLKDVMQGLNTDLQEVSYGIVMEDYERIAKSAQTIAAHPTPAPAILKKVVAHLGAEMPKFKAFDMQVHDTALELEKAAMEKDKEAIFKHYDKLIRGCVGCHQSYRKSVAEVLLSN